MKARPTAVSIVLGALLVAAAPAQSVFVPDPNRGSGNCNLIPFGHNSKTNATFRNQIYQSMITSKDMGNATSAVICDLAFIPCVAGIRRFDTIEIILAQTTATALSTTFSANLVTNRQVVLSASNYAWHNTPNAWNRIGLDRVYQYVRSRGNLVVQIKVTGAWVETQSTLLPGFRRAIRQRVFSFGWNTTPPATGTSEASATKIELLTGSTDLQSFGDGCRGSNGAPSLTMTGNPRINGMGNLTVTVTNCVANAGVLHAFGFTRYPAPVDLVGLGANGCKLYFPPFLIVGGQANSTGVYQWKTGIPNDPRLLCVQIYNQVFPADQAANLWRRTASNYGRILPGN